MEDTAGNGNNRSLKKNLFWIGIVTLLVGIKLILSFFIPGLKTPGELVLSGILLLVCTVNIFTLRSKV
jgi:hypothetical protein